MTYTFTEDLPEAEFSVFIEKLEHCNFMQKPMWASVKTTWQHTLCGVREGEHLIAAALLLIRRLPTGQKLVYSPRGLLTDYEDETLLKFFTREVCRYAKKIGAYMVRIDPEIILSRQKKDKKKREDIGFEMLKRLTEIGWIHKGFATDFHSYTQPRFNAEYPLYTEDGPKSDEFMRQEFDKKIRKFIGHYTESRGIFFTDGNSDEDIALFSSVSEYTEQRQHIILRDQEYFHRIREAYGEDCRFFFAKMDLNRFLDFLDTQPENDQTAEDRSAAQEFKKMYGPVVPLSALQILRSNNTAYLMYSGFNDKVFPRFRTTNQLRFEAMRYYRDRGCKIFSFMGINGELNDSLSDFKLKFNPEIVEYIGELEYPVRPLLYRFMTKFLPIAKRIYIKIALLIKGK